MKVHPRLFRFAGPRCVFYENMVRREPIGVKELLSGSRLTMEVCPEGIPAKGVPACVLSTLKLVEEMGAGKLV